jgi:stage V sporulation protein G
VAPDADDASIGVAGLCGLLSFFEGGGMEITDVRVYPVQDEKVQAFVSIVFDRCFMVNDIKIIRGKDGLFVSMPSRKRKNGDFKDVAHPLNTETRRWVEDRILGSYRDAVAGADSEVVPAASLEARRLPARPDDSPACSVSAPAAGEPSRQRTLEEVEKAHLGDSFWGVD